MGDAKERLVRASRASGRPSSDFDLDRSFVPPADRKLRDAGVLIAATEERGRAEIILTKRSPRLKHHPGQIALPGGKVDLGDADVIDAALREAQEEVGLQREAVEVIGTLPPHETVTGFRVTPVLAWVAADFVPVPELGEVDEVFFVPLDHATDPANFREEARPWRGRMRPYYIVPWGPHYIWGATARILRALADRMAHDAN